MTSNTAVIDSMNKCLIDMSPDFSCINISKIATAIVFSTLFILLFVVIIIKNNSNVVAKQRDKSKC